MKMLSERKYVIQMKELYSLCRDVKNINQGVCKNSKE